jgi:hypothetical protein
MALARWASHIVLHYIKDAPLAALTDTYKALQRKTTQPYEEALQEVGGQMAELAVSLGKHNVLLNNLKADLEELALVTEATRAALPGIGDEAVFNPNGRMHQILVGDMRTPPAIWRAKCGWKFGLTGHHRGRKVFECAEAVCGSCFPDERRRMLADTYQAEDEV